MENDDILKLDSTVLYGKNPVSWLLEIGKKQNFCPEFKTSSTILDGKLAFETICELHFNKREFKVSEIASSKKASKTRSSVKMMIAMGITNADLYRMSKVPGSNAEWRQRRNEEMATVGTVENTNVNASSLQPTDKCLNLSSEQDPESSTRTADLSVPVLPVIPEQNSANNLSQGDVDLSINHMGQLIEFCGRNALQHPVFQEIASSGPPHAPIFTISCTMGPFEIVQTRQCTKKKIRTYLAFYMLEKLRGNAEALQAISQQTAKDLQKLEEDVIQQYNDMKKSEVASSNFACTVRDCATLFSHDFHEFQRKLSGDKLTEIKTLAKNNEITFENAESLVEQLCQEQCGRGFQMTSDYMYRKLKRDDTNTYCFLEITFLGQVYSALSVGETEAEAKKRAAKKAVLMLLELSLD